jgi:outer membrane protein assembly factor BamB
MLRRSIPILLLAACTWTRSVPARAEEPRIGHPDFKPTPEQPVGFRGDGSGSYATRLAVTSWSATENIIWEADIGSWSNSGPVPAGDRVYTCNEPCELVCVNDADGKILWRFMLDYASTRPPEEAAEVRAQYKEAKPLLEESATLRNQIKKLKRSVAGAKDPAAKEDLARQLQEATERLAVISAALKKLPLGVGNKCPHTSPQCGNSTPTPVTDGQHVWAIFGNGVLGCLTRDGAKVWARNLGGSGLNQGYAQSPRLVEGKLIVPFNKSLLGLDATTGETIWSCGIRPGWCTPVPHKVGDESLVICGDGRLIRVHDGTVAADPKIKRDRHNYGSPIVVGNTYVYVDGHHFNNDSRALVIPETFPPETQPVEAWKTPTVIGGLIYASPVSYSNLVFGLNEHGALGIWKADTGELVLKKGTGCPRRCYASLTLAGDQVIATSEMGDMVVLQADAKATEIGRNKLPSLVTTGGFGHGIMGSPAVAGGRLYVRAKHSLYCIGKTDK